MAAATFEALPVEHDDAGLATIVLDGPTRRRAGTPFAEALRIERAPSLANKRPMGRAGIDPRLAKVRRVGRRGRSTGGSAAQPGVG
jgi:hypothetical protein